MQGPFCAVPRHPSDLLTLIQRNMIHLPYLRGGRMRYRRSGKRHSRRVTEAQRRATEEAYLNQVVQQQHPPIVVQQSRPMMPSGQQRKKPDDTVFYVIIIAGLLIISCIAFQVIAIYNTTTTVSSPIITPDALITPDITNTTASFCSTHQCIPNYPNGKGSIVGCKDGTYSHSGGRRGACSYHGGESP